MNIFPHLLTLFIVMPLIELALLFRLHEYIGWGRTLSLVIITGFIGAALVKKQGLQILREMQQETAAGRLPAAKLIDGFMILIAGAFLITPGVITDVSGFLLLAPPIRTWIRKKLQRLIEQKIKDGSVNIHYRQR